MRLLWENGIPRAHTQGGLWGLDLCPLQQNSEIPLFSSALSFQQGRFSSIEKA